MSKMHDFEAYYLEPEDLIHPNQPQANKKRRALNKMTNEDFLDEMLRYPKINEVVGEGFPAFDIAQRLKENNWPPSKKQRIALSNVYLFNLYETY